MLKTPSEIGADVLHSRYKMARKDNTDQKGVLSLAVCMKNPLAGPMWTAAALGYMVQVQKIERVTGPAPKGPLEREVSRIVTEMLQ
eukprot:4726052-Pyramimonas_sp.AAC.1